MIDIDHVLEGLACLKEPYEVPDEDCEACHYNPDSCPYEIAGDAYELLKEQKSKPMIENEHGWNCPSCGMKLIGKTASGYPCDLIDLPEDDQIHFCPKCGQEVKWE